MKHRAEYKSLALNCEDLSCSPPSNLHRFRGHEAQDPKDHIFAHCGLCPCSCDPHVIDYSTPKEALYTKYTRNISQKQPVSPPLGGVGRSIVLLPSWVPDYCRMQPCLAKAMINISTHFSAGANFPPRKCMIPSDQSAAYIYRYYDQGLLQKASIS
jgi:hypothetical protein